MPHFLHFYTLLLSLPFQSMADIGFVEVDADRREALKEAKTPEQWAALMPEAEAHSFVAEDGTQLPLYLFPAALEDDSKPGAVVLFAGGAFRSGNPSGMYRQALDLSRRGFTVVLAKYRGTEDDGVPILQSMRDGRDALAWVRSNAEELGINPRKISPYHHLHENLPPACLMMGGKEKPAQRRGFLLAVERATELGALWDAHLHAAMPHGAMMGSAQWQPEVYRANIEILTRFLRRHGF